MADEGLYEKVLGGLTNGKGLGPARVRASASVVLWRRVRGELEVFWVERSPNLPFMGGFHAFPGGGRSRQDRQISVHGVPEGIDQGPADFSMPAGFLQGVDLEPVLAPGILGCVIRELFEETGLLLARGSLTGDHLRLTELRARLEAGEAELADVLSESSLELDASRLVFAGRWLTPPMGPVRFDNRFFLLEWPMDRGVQPEIWSGELTRGTWVRPADAYEEWWRGKVITAPPILHILQVLDQDGLPDGLARLRSPAEANLGPFRRIEFRPGVLMLPLRTPTLPPATHTNSFVLGTGEAVLVDPGSPYAEEIEGLLEALHELQARDRRRVVAIWLTHHHPDHVGGVEAVRQALGLPVCAHRYSAEHLATRGLAIDRELEDGESLILEGDIPFRVRIIHTPGHARGHLMFFEETGGSLIAGDLVAGIGTTVIDPPEGNMDDYLRSLEKAKGLDAKTLFPAHGPPTVSPRGKLDEYLRHRLRREDRIEKAWRTGRRGKELLAAAYDDVPPLALPLAERQLEAHLERLRRAGRL
jgi:glyoxylase-like metal-dependent hydrolase (beta-lactamase superfamily II)/8-oxo-dGTP pyrophosphatase MutT (NUDIX family)